MKSSKFYERQFRLLYISQTAEGTYLSRCEERIPDMKENEKNEKNDISSCYLESMLKFSFMSFYNRSSTNDTFYRTMRKNNFTDMDEESDDSEIEGSCNRLDFTELDESYSV
uniref:Uncharacterized protein n=1 Tax=Rhizophagus irregularis (strain DAOM 181602 / DAOM 197198 / MUCL 43194) TaxID=747089 RepID=U9UC42_RHIID